MALSSTNPKAKFLVSTDEARKSVENTLIGYAVPPKNAEIVVQCLIAADPRGMDTHGMNRIPSYMEQIHRGVLSATTSLTVTQIIPVAAQVDGHYGVQILGITCEYVS